MSIVSSETSFSHPPPRREWWKCFNRFRLGFSFKSCKVSEFSWKEFCFIHFATMERHDREIQWGQDLLQASGPFWCKWNVLCMVVVRFINILTLWKFYRVNTEYLSVHSDLSQTWYSWITFIMDDTHFPVLKWKLLIY
jgi:hypothetical protein